MTRRPLRALPRRREGVTSVEFAVCAAALLTLTFGVIELGLMLWTGNVLQMTAALTARCSALRAPDCTGAAQYAVATAGRWAPAGQLLPADVWVQANAACGSTPGSVTSGKFTVVAVTSRAWSTGVIAPRVLTATACFPSGR